MDIMERRAENASARKRFANNRNSKDLIRRAEENGICSKVTSANVVEGWEGKAKGLLQVLLERGFIHATNLENYTMNERQDACGILIPDTSLKLLMANCVDFGEESLYRQMGMKWE